MKLDWYDKNVLILGLGATGLSCARWLARQDGRLAVADSRSTPPNSEALARELPRVPLITGKLGAELLRGMDVVVRSPGVSNSEPVVVAAQRERIPVVGDVELFALAVSEIEADSARFGLGRPKVLAVTGTNGKSTVTSMAGAMCREAGLSTVVAGNIGLPVLDALIDLEDRNALDQVEIFVLELSSFQLETTWSLDADASTVLNVSEDHLDRYANVQAYGRAKSRIFQGNGVQVLNRQDAVSLAMTLADRRVFTFGADRPATGDDWGILDWAGERWLAQGRRNLLSFRELPLAGLPNALNALAALALCRALGLSYVPLLDALKNFKGLPHRVQKVAMVGGVTFYDDSKGTNVGASVAAIKGFARPVVLIAGGDGKGQDFTPMAAPVKARARAVVLIGRDREKIAEALAQTAVPLKRVDTMEQAVVTAFAEAREGDVVLLSPACASFDMYRDYEHRAQEFVAAVERLKASHDRAA